MRLGLRVVTSDNVIQQKTLQALSQLIQPRLKALIPKIQDTARNLLANSLENSPEYQSLLGGRLQTEVGVVNPEATLIPLTQALANSVTVKLIGPKISNSQLLASIRLSAAPRNLGDQGKHLGVYTTRKGAQIAWLDWLLNYGDQIIVRDYDVDFSAPFFSRTGGAIMSGAGSIFGNTEANSDGGWRVPPEFSGTEDNNFLTRSIDQASIPLEQFMTQSFKNL